MVDTSVHLRHTLGLPVKEFTRASCSDSQMQEEPVVTSPGERHECYSCVNSSITNHPLIVGKDKKDKGEKKAAFSSTGGKDKKEGKQKLQTSKEEVSHYIIVQ